LGQENGDKYSPATIHSLLSGINCTLQEKKVPFSIFDKQNSAFSYPVKNCIEREREGVGANKKHTEFISVDAFWDKGMLGYSTQKILQRTVFFYVELHYALRGVDEQYSLVPWQFTRSPPGSSVYNANVYYEYTEFISKNNQHHYKDINTKNKVVRAFAQVGNDHCIVKLLDFYLLKLKPQSPFLYMHLLEQSLMMVSYGTLVNGMG